MSTQGSRLTKIRQTLGLSQEEFGAIFDIKKQFVSNIEKDRVVLNNEKLVKLLVDYNVNINYLLAGIGEMFIGQDKTDHTGIDEAEFKKLFKQCMKEEGFI